MTSTARPAATLLSHDEVETLIATAQDVPTTTTSSGDVVYSYSPAAETALAELVARYQPLINSIATKAKVQETEDAAMELTAEFIATVRRYTVGSKPSFKQSIKTILEFKLSDLERTSGLISVKENAHARYRRLMQKHDWDVAAAYADAKSGQFDPDTFLALHNALYPASLDAADAIGGGDSDSRYGNAGEERASAHHRADRLMAHAGSFAPSPEDTVTTSALVDFAFSKVTDRQETILRLRYGFDDLPTQNIRSGAGFRTDAADLVMSDRQVAQAIGSTRPTVQRLHAEALKTMREAIESTDYDGVSGRSTGR